MVSRSGLQLCTYYCGIRTDVWVWDDTAACKEANCGCGMIRHKRGCGMIRPVIKRHTGKIHSLNTGEGQTTPHHTHVGMTSQSHHHTNDTPQYLHMGVISHDHTFTLPLSHYPTISLSTTTLTPLPHYHTATITLRLFTLSHCQKHRHTATGTRACTRCVSQQQAEGEGTISTPTTVNPKAVPSQCQATGHPALFTRPHATQFCSPGHKPPSSVHQATGHRPPCSWL